MDMSGGSSIQLVGLYRLVVEKRRTFTFRERVVLPAVP
jgi:hypothetical protein